MIIWAKITWKIYYYNELKNLRMLTMESKNLIVTTVREKCFSQGYNFLNSKVGKKKLLNINQSCKQSKDL